MTVARQVCTKNNEAPNLNLMDGWLKKKEQKSLIIPIADPKIVTVIPMLNHTHILIPPKYYVSQRSKSSGKKKRKMSS